MMWSHTSRGPLLAGALLLLVVGFVTADWIEVKLIKGRTKIVRKKGIGILSHFPDEYKVTFEFYANKNGEKWGNIVQFTPGGRSATPFGEHVLTAFYHQIEQQLMVTASVSGNRDFHTIKDLLPNRWHKIAVSQEKINGDYYYNVNVNGETLQTAINTDAKVHRNVTVFTGAPWYEALEGQVQKLSFHYKPRCVDTGSNCAENKRRNYCTRYKSFMMRECKATCGFCGSSSSSRRTPPVADVVNCKRGNGGCSHICRSSKCSCPRGFKLAADKRRCADINECASGNGGCHQQCVNQQGSYKCGCKPGYTLEPDGKVCADINECSRNPTICEHMCENTKGSYRCTCMEGFVMVNNRCKYDCPPNIASPSCSVDPCRVGYCSADRNARCIANYCGGCNAGYYNKRTGKKVACDTRRKVCEDKSALCKVWKRKRYCDRFKDFMNEKCPHQCRFCYGGKEYQGPALTVVKPTLGPRPTVPRPVDGSWSNWGSFSRCTESCGGGVETRRRQCDNPKPRAGGNICPGVAIEHRRCNAQKCRPKTSRPRPTTTTTTRSTTPYYRRTNRPRTRAPPRRTQRPRTRRPTQAPRTRAPSSGGATSACAKKDHSMCKSYAARASTYCARGGWIKKNCAEMCGLCSSSGARSSSQSTSVVVKKQPKPAQTGGASNLPACSKRDHSSCGGYKAYKSRYCGQGWVRRNCAEMCGVCSSSSTAATSRATPAPSRRTVHGNWGSWTSFTPCSRTCGGGDQSRSRVCNNPSPSNGGRQCDGSARENRRCNDQACTRRPAPTRGTTGGLPACTKRDHNSCKSYRPYKNRYCTRGWVKTNCGEMCGHCTSGGARATARPRTARPTRRTARPTRARTAAPARATAAKATGCKDHSVCGGYAKMKTWACTRRWIKNNCKNMCGTCTVPASGAVRPTAARRTAARTAATARPTRRPTRRPATRRPAPAAGGGTCKKPDHSVCKSYARQSSYYCKRRWIKQNCEAMCGLCTASGGAAPQPTRRARTQRPRPRTQRPRPRTNNRSSGLPVCAKSDHNVCGQYKKWAASYCSQGWIRENCKQMCGKCRQRKK